PISGTHLITGALGGLGAQLTQRLAAAGAKHLVLLVKNPLPARDTWDKLPSGAAEAARVAVIKQLEGQGTRVTVVVVDLADESALRTQLDALNLGDDPLQGIWHTAM